MMPAAERNGCGSGATFNLNSGTMGKKQMIARLGDIGVKDIPIEEYDPASLDMSQLDPHLLQYLKTTGADDTVRFNEEFRIPADEVRQVYEGDDFHRPADL